MEYESSVGPKRLATRKPLDEFADEGGLRRQSAIPSAIEIFGAARRGRRVRRVRVVAHERLAVVKAAVIGDVSSRAVGGAFELGFDAGSIEETSKGGGVTLGFAPTAVASRAPTSVRPAA